MAVGTLTKTKRAKKGKRDGGILDPGGGGGGGWNGDEGLLLEVARELAAREGYTLAQDFEEEFLHAIRSREVAEDQDHTNEEAIRNVKKVVWTAISLVRNSFLVSIAMGILTLACLTGNLDAKDKTKELTVYAPNVVAFSILQFLTFGAGLFLTVLFAVRSF